MPARIDLERDAARRFMTSRHLLSPPRGLPPEPASVLRVVERLGSLQFDPLEVAGRNHDLVLAARIDGYRRAWTEEHLYGTRELYETYNKGLTIVPTAELPHGTFQESAACGSTLSPRGHGIRAYQRIEHDCRMDGRGCDLVRLVSSVQLLHSLGMLLERRVPCRLLSILQLIKLMVMLSPCD